MVLACNPRGCIPGILERLVDGLQEQTFLGVDIERFPGRDVEEQGIEVSEAGEESAPLAVAPALRQRPVHVCFEEPLERPALGRNFPDAIPAFLQVVPVLLQRSGARISAAQPDDRDSFRFPRRRGCRRAGARSDHRRPAGPEDGNFPDLDGRPGTCL